MRARLLTMRLLVLMFQWAFRHWSMYHLVQVTILASPVIRINQQNTRRRMLPLMRSSPRRLHVLTAVVKQQVWGTSLPIRLPRGKGQMFEFQSREYLVCGLLLETKRVITYGREWLAHYWLASLLRV